MQLNFHYFYVSPEAIIDITRDEFSDIKVFGFCVTDLRHRTVFVSCLTSEQGIGIFIVLSVFLFCVGSFEVKLLEDAQQICPK